MAGDKPEFRNGFPIRDLRDGSMISGPGDGEELVLGRRGDEFFAIGCPTHLDRCTPPKFASRDDLRIRATE